MRQYFSASTLGVFLLATPLISNAEKHFSSIPLRLNNKVEIIKKGVPPNVMFYIDNSGSMLTPLNIPSDICPEGTDLALDSPPRNNYDGTSTISYSHMFCLIPRYTSCSSFGLATGARDSSGALYCRHNSKYNYSSSVTGEMRITAVRNALNTIIDDYSDQLNIGIQALNDDNNFNSKLIDEGYFSNNKELLKRSIQSLYPSGSTPATSHFLGVAKKVMNNLRYRCQKSFIVMMSDGEPSITNLTKSDWLQGVRYYPRRMGEQYTPSFDGYDDDYIVNGTTFHDYYGATLPADLWIKNGWYMYEYNAPNALSRFTKILSTKDFKTSGVDKAGKSWNDPEFTTQIIKTYTVGFGSGITPSGRQFLENSAKSGDGLYLSATDEASLTQAFHDIFDKIQTKESNYAVVKKFSSVAPTILTKPKSIKGATSVDMAIATFLDSGTWSSQLRFYKTNDTGEVTNPNQFYTPDYSQRKALIDFGSSSQNRFALVSWLYNNKNLASLRSNNSYFGITSTGKDKNEWINVLLPWVTRLVYASDKDINYAITSAGYLFNGKPLVYRVRPVNSSANPPSARDMGDVLDAPVNALGDYLVTAANDGMVYLFAKNSQPSPTSIDTDSYRRYKPYSLKLNYIPANIPNSQGTLAKIFHYQARPGYGISEPHIYGINGGLVLRRSTNDTVFTVGALGQGGRGIYGLNVSAISGKDTTWAQKVPLFTYTDDNLGYVLGTPQVSFVSLKNSIGRPVNYGNKNIARAIFFGNGYNHTGKPTLYILRLNDPSNSSKRISANGSLITKITVSNVFDGGLSQPTLVDVNGDGVVDLVYAGDTNGNMYRFDLRGNSPKDWYAIMIYKGIASQPITSAPVIAQLATEYYSKQEIIDDSNGITAQTKHLNDLPKTVDGLSKKNIQYAVVFGTGSDMYNEDVEDHSLQSVYGIFDYIKNPIGAINNKPVTKSDLLAQTWTCQDSEICNLSTNQFPKADSNTTLPQKAYTEKGWYYDLNINNKSGERVVTRPILLLQTVFLTTRIYGHSNTISNDGLYGDPCVSTQTSTSNSVQSRFIQTNVRTGGKTDKYLFKGNTVKDVYVPFGKDDIAYSSKLYPALFVPQYFTTSINPYKNKLPQECLLPENSTKRITYLKKQNNPNLCEDLLKKLSCISGKSPTDIGGNGQECIPSNKLILESNTGCFDKDSANKHFLTGVNTDTGLIKPYLIKGGICPDTNTMTSLKFGIKRLSWRELF